MPYGLWKGRTPGPAARRPFELFSRVANMFLSFCSYLCVSYTGGQQAPVGDSSAFGPGLADPPAPCDGTQCRAARTAVVDSDGNILAGASQEILGLTYNAYQQLAKEKRKLQRRAPETTDPSRENKGVKK